MASTELSFTSGWGRFVNNRYSGGFSVLDCSTGDSVTVGGDWGTVRAAYVYIDLRETTQNVYCDGTKDDKWVNNG